jgi:hypothetical protein
MAALRVENVPVTGIARLAPLANPLTRPGPSLPQGAEAAIADPESFLGLLDTKVYWDVA